MNKNLRKVAEAIKSVADLLLGVGTVHAVEYVRSMRNTPFASR